MGGQPEPMRKTDLHSIVGHWQTASQQHTGAYRGLPLHREKGLIHAPSAGW